jgi:hypothetical protein
MSINAIETIEDEVDANLFIGQTTDITRQFDVIDMEVEHTTFNKANYASGVVVPAQEDDAGASVSLTSARLRALVGQPAFLYARTSIQVGTPVQNKDNALIFKGRVANIVATGEGNLISVLLFDPSQESFSYDEEGETTNNFMNNSVDFSTIEGEISEVFGVEEDQQSLPAADIVETILTDPQFNLNFSEGEVFILGEDEPFGQNEFAPSPFEDGGGTSGSGVNLLEADYIIEMREPETTPTEELVQAINIPLNFQKTDKTIYNILDDIQTRTDSKMWFDRFGVLHFGGISPVQHELRLIKETTAGLTTPAYQGVKVVSRAKQSANLDEEEARAINDLDRRDDFETFVVEASIGRQDVREVIKGPQGEREEGEIIGSENPIVFHDSDDTVVAQPQFEYIDYSLLTQTEVLNAAKSFLEDILKQSADGEITVVGFPEVELFDGLRMPDTDVQPMGGSLFAVEEIVHEISSEGFITRLSVSGVFTPPEELQGDFESINIGEFAVSKLPPATTDTEDASAVFDPRLNAAAGLDPYTEIRSYNPEGTPEVAAPGRQPGNRGGGGGFGLLQSIVASFKAALPGRETADPRLQSTLETDPVEDTGFRDPRDAPQVNESGVFDRPPTRSEAEAGVRSVSPIGSTAFDISQSVLAFIEENFGDTEINVDDDEDDGLRRPDR